MAQPGYDAATGLNTGDLGFQSQQGYIDGKPYYAPISFNPGSYGGLDAPGYINFFSDYNPETNPNAYVYSREFQAPNKTISYGTAPARYQLTGTQGDPTINGFDYSPNQSYAALAALGIGTPKAATYGVNDGAPGFGGSAASVNPYTPTTEPGYRAPQYSQPSSPERMQDYTAPTAFLYGDNGSLGSVSGVFSNNTTGQSSAFYSNQPLSLTQGNPNPTIGQFNQNQASNPGLQALQQSRSQP